MRTLRFFLTFVCLFSFCVSVKAQGSGTPRSNSFGISEALAMNGTINACDPAWGGCPLSGSGDSAASINAAIAFACNHTSNTGLWHVLIPPGSYDIYRSVSAIVIPEIILPQYYGLTIPSGCQNLELSGSSSVLHYKLRDGADLNTNCPSPSGSVIQGGRGAGLLVQLNQSGTPTRTRHVRIHDIELNGGVDPAYMYGPYVAYGSNPTSNCIGWDLSNKGIMFSPDGYLEDVRFDHLNIHNFAAELIWGGGTDYTSAAPPAGSTAAAVGTYTVSSGIVTAVALTQGGTYQYVPRVTSGESPCGPGGGNPSFVATLTGTSITNVTPANTDASGCADGSYNLVFLPQGNRPKSPWLPPFEISDSVLYNGVEGISISGPLRASRNQMHDFLANVFDSNPEGEQMLDHNSIWNFGLANSQSAFGITTFGITCPDLVSCQSMLTWTGYEPVVQIDHNIVHDGTTGLFTNSSSLRVFDNTFTDLNQGVVIVQLPVVVSDSASDPTPSVWTSNHLYTSSTYIQDNAFDSSTHNNLGLIYGLTGAIPCTSGSSAPSWLSASIQLNSTLQDNTCTWSFKGTFNTPANDIVTGNTCVALNRNFTGSCVSYGLRNDAKGGMLMGYNMKLAGNRTMNQTGRTCSISGSVTDLPAGPVVTFQGGIMTGVEEYDNSGSGTADEYCTLTDTDTATVRDVPVPTADSILATHGVWHPRAYLVTLSYTVADAPTTVSFSAVYCDPLRSPSMVLPILSSTLASVGRHDEVVPVSLYAYGPAASCNVTVHGQTSGSGGGSVTATVSISEAGKN